MSGVDYIAPRPAILNRDVAPLDVADFAQPAAESGQVVYEHFGRAAAEEPNHRHCRLLRSRRERQTRRSAEQRDELAALHHSITSSARASSACGTSRPSALAVLRLINNLNLLTC